MAKKKPTIKASQINLSEHFDMVKEKYPCFPTCKKMTISNINKFYEACINDLKNCEALKEKEDKRRKDMRTEPIAAHCEVDLSKSQLYSALNTARKKDAEFARSLSRTQIFTKKQIVTRYEQKSESQRKLKSKPPLPEFRHSKQSLKMEKEKEPEDMAIGAWDNPHIEQCFMEELP